MKILMLIAPLLVLTACAGSMPSADLDVSLPAPSLTQPCRPPLRLPEREVTQAEAEGYWLRDRRSLVDCASRHQGLTQWVQEVVEVITASQ
ncbi:hypothetical protein DPMD02_36 [Desulfofustis phage LS06-2018-MD02]|nr:hypothetical protein DPMD02_36 [Desulfofustis phage LS06-2018-MD02]